MAPELFWGKPASIRSDIYALGVVLYQWLAGDFSRPVTTDWAKTVLTKGEFFETLFRHYETLAPGSVFSFQTWQSHNHQEKKDCYDEPADTL